MSARVEGELQASPGVHQPQEDNFRRGVAVGVAVTGVALMADSFRRVWTLGGETDAALQALDPENEFGGVGEYEGRGFVRGMEKGIKIDGITQEELNELRRIKGTLSARAEVLNDQHPPPLPLLGEQLAGGLLFFLGSLYLLTRGIKKGSKK